MNKFLHTLYDITDEATSGNIEKLAEFIDGASISSSARNAKIPSIEEMDELPTESCALTLFVSGTGEIKKFAHHKPELAELNIAMLLKNHEQLPDEICKIAAYNLSKAAKRFELSFPEELNTHIPDDSPASMFNVKDIDELTYMSKLAKYRESLAEKKEAMYALPGKKKRYPLHDESYIKTACGYFEKYKHEFNSLDKLAFCKNTQAAGVRENVQIEGNLAKYAELNTARVNPDFVLHIKNRQNILAGNEEAVKIYDELLEKSAEIKEPEKLAAALEAVDKKFRLNKHWGARVEEPLLSVLSPMAKEASIKYGGIEITSNSFSNLRGRDLNGIIDNHTYNELTTGTPESLDVFNSLPMPIKDALVEKLSDE